MWLKQGDLYPPLRIDTNADVTGALSTTAYLRRKHQTQAATFPLTSVIPSEGVLEYTWQAGDTDVTGTYHVEAVVVFADGSSQTFPQRSHLELIIRENLA